MSAFFSIFVAVFIAEIGDKTQLAAFLFAAEGDRSPWLVFLASASALVASTAIAAFAGGMLGRFVEGPIIKLAAGGLFILIGVATIFGALRQT